MGGPRYRLDHLPGRQRHPGLGLLRRRDHARYMRQRGAARDATKLADWPAYLDSINLDMRPPAPFELIDNSASSSPLQVQASALVDKVLKASA